MRWLFWGLSVLLTPIVLFYAFLLYTSPYVRCASGANDIVPAWKGCARYAKDHNGLLPPLDVELGRLMFDRNIMASKYGITGKDVTCQYDRTDPFPKKDIEKKSDQLNNSDRIDDHSWWYLGYEIHNEDEGRAFVLAYLKRALDGGPFESELQRVNNPAITFSRLHGLPEPNWPNEKPDQAFMDTLDKVPVWVERPGHYGRLKGGHVVYRDGHCEYLDYPGKFPMTKSFIESLELLDRVGTYQKP